MFILKNPKQRLAIMLLLAVLMLATRFHHFGSWETPPDASLAVFFLAGAYLQSIFYFPLFLMEAAFIDYAAISNGVSSWCITPAYVFLVPTYASLWFAGYGYVRRHHEGWHTLVPLVSALFVGSSAAFLISNGSFYLFSPYFGQMSLHEYAARAAKYYPPYVGIAFFYVALTAFLHVAVVRVGKFGRSSSLETDN